jgi:hypothetical protein
MSAANPDTAVRAYWYSSAAPPYISYAEPPLDDDQVFPGQSLTYKITDASTSVAAGSVALKVNGAAQAPPSARPQVLLLFLCLRRLHSG